MSVGYQDPYRVLGVLRTAQDTAIRSAYRQRVKECHPDLHPNDAVAEERFKALTLAYEILGDPDKRRRFDRGELGADGVAKAPREAPAEGGGSGAAAGSAPFSDPYMRENAFDDIEVGSVWENISTPFPNDGRDEFAAYQTPPAEDDLSDLFREIFREGGNSGEASVGRGSGGNGLRGRDMRYSLTISFAEACYGVRKKLPLNTGRDATIAVPPAAENGQVLRLSGMGQPGATGTLAGDLLVEILVEPHPRFTRKGLDLYAPLSVSLSEALAGGRLTMQGLRGQLAVVVPKGTASGQMLRVKGMGLRAGEMQGDLYLTVSVVLPPQADEALINALRAWEAEHPYRLPGR